MRTTIDSAGRVVIPKELRERLGLRPGDVEFSADCSSVRIEPVCDESLEERDGRLVIPASGRAIDADEVRALRDAGQR